MYGLYRLDLDRIFICCLNYNFLSALQAWSLNSLKKSNMACSQSLGILQGQSIQFDIITFHLYSLYRRLNTEHKQLQ